MWHDGCDNSRGDSFHSVYIYGIIMLYVLNNLKSYLLIILQESWGTKKEFKMTLSSKALIVFHDFYHLKLTRLVISLKMKL